MTDRRYVREGFNPTALPEALIWLRDANTGEDENLTAHEAEWRAAHPGVGGAIIAPEDDETCECAWYWFPGAFAPCDGDYGIQACDGCTAHGDDFDTAYAIAAALTEKTGRAFDVWYEAEPVIFTSEAPRFQVIRWDGITAEHGLATEEDARSAAMFWTGSHVEQQPQNNGTNPILVAFREYMAEGYNAEQMREAAELWADAVMGHAPGMLAQDLADEAVLSADPDRDPPRSTADAWTDHARRVLTRLAHFAESEPVL